jgi:hypothetical protein
LTGSCSAVAGDFNGDGLADYASACVPTYREVFFNQGAGSFGGATLLPGGCTSVMAAADLNSDGVSDLICSGSMLVLSVSQRDAGAPDPNFVDHSYPTSSIQVGLAVADFNGDGHPDVLVIEQVGFSVFLGIGDGGLLPEAYYNEGTMTYIFAEAAVADFDGDGNLDIALRTGDSAYPPAVYIWLNDGGGSFGHATPVDLGNDLLDLAATGLAAGDFNEDHRMDLAVSFADRIELFFGQDGGFGPPALLSLSTGTSTGLVAEDFNGDGHLDLLLLGAGGSNFLAGLGNGTFFSPSFFGIPGPGLVVADFQGDGTLDLAALNLGNTTTTWTLWQNGCR